MKKIKRQQLLAFTRCGPLTLAVFCPYFGPFKVYFVIKKLLFSHKSYMSIGIILLVRMSDTGDNSKMQLRLQKSLKYPHT